MKVSFRISLVVVIPLLVVGTGGLIAARSYQTARQSVRASTRALFTEVTARTVAEAKAHLALAVPPSEELRLRLAGGSLPADADALAREELAILRANPSLTWVSWSAADGSFTGAFRPGDGAGWRVNQSRIVDGKTVLDEHDVDAAGAWTLRKHDPDTGYDPRTRPFYTLAGAAHARVFTPPYVFFNQGVPGITCATPAYDAAGALRGVFTVDFDLNALSEFVATLSLGAHGRVFVFAPDGTVIAHPTVRLVEKDSGGAAGSLVTMQAIDDPVARALYARGKTGGDGTQELTITEGGARWIASETPFHIEGGPTWIVAAMAPETDFMGGVRRASVTSLLISLVALAIALALAVVLANRIANPLTRLAAEMEEVGQFRLEEKPPLDTVFREVALMNRALTTMKGGLRSFASFVPRDLVRAMLASGGEAKLEGKLRDVTVFFSDIAGFTTLAEGLRPEALVTLLGGYLDEMTRAITGTGGTVDKFIGDGVMAFWGAPRINVKHAAAACEAAVMCQRKLASRTGAPLTTRIGIASGEVVVGNIGSYERMNYTVMGDVVNLAARLEGLNKQYGTRIMIAAETARAAAERIVARPIDVVAVKGKSEAVRVYEVLALTADGDARAVELARLGEVALDAYLARDFATAIEAYEEILAGWPGDGPAGVLLARARAYAAAAPDASWSGVHVAVEK